MTDLTAREIVEKHHRYDDLPTFPKVNNHFLATAPGNEHLLKFMTEKPDNPIRFKGKRIGIIATHGVEETEVTIPRKWFEARGAICHLVSPNHIEYAPAFGIQFPEIAKTHVLAIQFTENSGWIPIDAHQRGYSRRLTLTMPSMCPGAPGIRISCAPTQPCCPSFKNFRRQANPWARCATARRSF